MCGIVGYIGLRSAVPVLLDGLKRLEYRGYDSAGVAVIENNSISIKKRKGKVQDLESTLTSHCFSSSCGIAHTRWATHGEPNENNAHPHTDCTGEIALVHNGIIENYAAIKKYLTDRGHIFSSDTDTEVIAHLVEEHFNGSLIESVILALAQVEGTYGIAVISTREPDKIVVARKGSPLLIGKGDGENFIASDVAAILRYTNEIIYLEDGETAEVTRESFCVRSAENEEVLKKVQQVTWSIEMIEKAGYPHFMLKEIFEQTVSLQNTMRGRLNYEDGTARLDGVLKYM